MKRYNKCKLAVLLCSVFILSAGCGGETNEKQVGYRQYGITCMQQGKYEDAVNYFQKALDQSIGKVTDMELDICMYKAQAQYLSGDIEGAEETYTAVINYNGDAKAYFLRGSLYYAQGDEAHRKQAQKDFAQAIEKEPEEYELYIGIYEIMEASEPENAQEYLQKALGIEGDEARDHMEKGRIYYLLGDSYQAKELLKKAVKEDMPEANYYLTEIYGSLGETEAAEETFQTYLDSGLADSEGLYNIGMTQMKGGRYKRAISCFDTALQMKEVPNKQAIERMRIIACEHAGNFEKAKEYLHAYRKSYPGDDSMEKEETFLETR